MVHRSVYARVIIKLRQLIEPGTGLRWKNSWYVDMTNVLEIGIAAWLVWRLPLESRVLSGTEGGRVTAMFTWGIYDQPADGGLHEVKEQTRVCLDDRIVGFKNTRRRSGSIWQE